MPLQWRSFHLASTPSALTPNSLHSFSPGGVEPADGDDGSKDNGDDGGLFEKVGVHTAE